MVCFCTENSKYVERAGGTELTMDTPGLFRAQSSVSLNIINLIQNVYCRLDRSNHMDLAEAFVFI